MQSFLSNVVQPEGWLKWKGSPFFRDTLFYGEYTNSGPGASSLSRVKWPGYQVFKKSGQVKNFFFFFFFGYKVR
ncbi:putative pectinesterase [Rosa chinensis]|uniref:Putative pectinesterase n=1 Tax=Rosa chinensis TaxID=74649 RepID=A0A2P6RL48_ROSCH|nr:putative pectinesterase [Rosa chinensis]